MTPQPAQSALDDFLALQLHYQKSEESLTPAYDLGVFGNGM